jgi:uncharacterized membrane protein (UPF0127 family)
MFQREINPHEGILMVQDSESRVNSSIHMFFMNFDISVVWLDNQLCVVDAKIARRWQPMVAPKSPAKYILESHPDRLADFTVGDQIDLVTN